MMLVFIPAVASGQEALHQRIDDAIRAASPEFPTELCSDADFLRRVYLDLVGTIPPAEEAGQFLDDSSPDKRTALIDRLLADPRHAHHMANVFDIMLMERRAAKHVKSPEWEQYLLVSIRENKPYNQMAREILSADGVDPAQRGPARFYLDREAETNQLTRDVGRIFFGRDLQCAQCHDHPVIGDYAQAEYYGIYAFLNRSYLFNDKKAKLNVLAEKAEGDAKFESVFDPSSKGTALPQLPGGPPIADPDLPEEARYEVKPAKDVRPVPKYSRREQLAEAAASGENQFFNRNLANRLWALMMGRGLVEPVDLHHGDNSPSHPELLQLLADELASMQFDIKSFLRELVLTETYQRRIDLPSGLDEAAKPASQRLAAFAAEGENLAAALEQSQQAANDASGSLTAAQNAESAAAQELANREAPLAAAKKAAEAAEELLAKSQSQFAGQKDVVQTITEAVQATGAVVAKLPDDKDLSAAAATFAARQEQIAAEIAALEKTLAEQQSAAKSAADLLAAEQAKLAEFRARLDQARNQVQTQLSLQSETSNKLQSDLAATHQLERRRLGFELLAQLANAHEAADQNAVTAVRENIAEHWSGRFLLRTLEPLSPEQLAWSLLEISGQVASQRAAVTAELDKKQPLDDAARNDPEKAEERAEQIEAQVRAKLGGNVAAFASLFAAGPGQPQGDFFATVDQALFFANGGQVLGWLAPSGQNLTARLTKIEDPNALAEELYLAVLTRRPADDEVKDVQDFLADRTEDRAAAVQEMVWGLVTSTEFRFNH